MRYASFSNLPASTKPLARSNDAGRTIPAGVGAPRLAAVLALAASAELFPVALPAYSAAVLYHWILPDSSDSAKYMQELLLISILQLLASLGLRQYSRLQTQPLHVFLGRGASSVFFVFSFFISVMFLLKISEGCSRATVIAQSMSVLFTVLCTRAIWFSQLQPVIASALIDAAHHNTRRGAESLLPIFRSGRRHRDSDHPFVRVFDGSHRHLSRGLSRRGRNAT